MLSIGNNNTINYFKSDEVKVFPCAYRGQKLTTDSTYTLFDPEARLNTEYNLTLPKHLNGRATYLINKEQIVDGDNTILHITALISGYYFEINHVLEEDEDFNGGYLAIAITNREIVSDESSSFLTWVIAPTDNYTSEVLDYLYDEDNTYYFLGLGFTSANNIVDNTKRFCYLNLAEHTNTAVVESNQIKDSTANNKFINEEFNTNKLTVTAPRPGGTSDTYFTINGPSDAYVTTANGENIKLLNKTEPREGFIELSSYQGITTGKAIQLRKNTAEGEQDLTATVLKLENDKISFKQNNSDKCIIDTFNSELFFAGNISCTDEITCKTLSTQSLSEATYVMAAEIETDSITDSRNPSLDYTYKLDNNGLELKQTGSGFASSKYKSDSFYVRNTNGTSNKSIVYSEGSLKLGKLLPNNNTTFVESLIDITYEENQNSNGLGYIKLGNKTTNNDSAGVYLASTGNISASGEVQANTFYATSDRRLKENIKDYKPDNSILDIKVKEYNFINDRKKEKQIGFIAQDLQEKFPELVKENENGYLSIQESKLVYLLLEEVKKLKEEVEELKKEDNLCQ